MSGFSKRSMRYSVFGGNVAQVSGKKIILLLGIAGLAFIGVAFFVAQDLGGAARANRARLTRDSGVDAMTEEERQAYLETGLVVDGFSVGPEYKPNSEARVEGLLRVQGTLKNVGDRTVRVVHVVVFTKDEQGKVLSTFQQNVVGRVPLKPGGDRPINFRIPDKPTYKGFDHRLR